MDCKKAGIVQISSPEKFVSRCLFVGQQMLPIPRAMFYSDMSPTAFKCLGVGVRLSIASKKSRYHLDNIVQLFEVVTR